MEKVVREEKIYWDKQFRKERNINKKIERSKSQWDNINFPELLEIKKRVGKLKDRRVLSIGCGTSVYELFFLKNGAFVDFSDLSTEALKVQRKITKEFKNKVNFFQSSAEKLPLPNNHYDIIFGYALLHHIEDRNSFFREISRLLKGGGIAFFVDSYRIPMTDYVKRLPLLYKIYRKMQPVSISPVDEELVKHGEHGLREKDINIYKNFFTSFKFIKICFWNIIFRKIFRGKENSIFLKFITIVENTFLKLIPSLKKYCNIFLLVCKK